MTGLLTQAGRLMGSERRKHKRVAVTSPVRFTEMSKDKKMPCHVGKTKNISERGLHLTSMTPLERNAYAFIELGDHVFSRHVKREEVLVISQKRVLAKVVWRRLNLETGLFETGLKFIASENRKEFELEIKQAEKLFK